MLQPCNLEWRVHAKARLFLAFWPWRSLPVNFFSFLAHMGMFFCFFFFFAPAGVLFSSS